MLLGFQPFWYPRQESRLVLLLFSQHFWIRGLHRPRYSQGYRKRCFLFLPDRPSLVQQVCEHDGSQSFFYQTADLGIFSDAQYWVYASSSGSFTSPLMKPGTYTMVLYKNELPVASQTVTVTAGGTITSNIASSSDPASTTPTWVIGESVHSAQLSVV